MNYQNKNLDYSDAELYDQRDRASVLDDYVIGLWKPFLANKIKTEILSGNIIDLGCGTGEYAQFLPKNGSVTCFDRSEAMLKRAKEKLLSFGFENVVFKTGSVYAIGYQNGNFDGALAIGILDYVEPGEFLKETARILKPGAKLILVFPNFWNDWQFARFIWHKISNKKGANAYSAFRIKYLAKKTGFKILEQASFANIFWAPESFQQLILPIWKTSDFIFSPIQKIWPVGANVYLLFEKL